MPEFDNDRLEQFFRKAAGKSDVSFNEDDWKKLEARLDAVEAGLPQAKKAGSKAAAAVAITLMLLLSGAVWFSTGLDKTENLNEISGQKHSATNETAQAFEEGYPTRSLENRAGQSGSQKAEADFGKEELRINRIVAAESRLETENQIEKTGGEEVSKHFGSTEESDADGREQTAITSTGLRSAGEGVRQYDKEKIFIQLIKGKPLSPAFAEKIKQKAVVELPGAEEETRVAEAVVREEHASEQKKHESLPKLSLLLSFAPDFSSTSHTEYSAPGRAFGAMVHYHLRNRWSLSAGVIKNAKRYTGDGEDYHPPTGYWKYYTNGIIPNTIDGSCSVLEFPVMVQYAFVQNGKSRWLAGAGASSYLMLSESYRYNFEQPNPGAKEGWDSRNSSRFLFNMVNFTVAYERQVLPGLMIGIEPYVKIPVEQIGWTNLRLFSTGASITLRYAMMRRQAISTPARSRGPD